jgi:hypothetical protein
MVRRKYMGEQPQYVAATSDATDPVGKLGNDHGFWDETWANWHGGYADEAAAREGLKAYALTL